MNRIAHAVFAGLLIALALIAYGVKEQTRALERAARAADRDIAALQYEIEMLTVEWAHVTSAASLERLSAELNGGPGLRDRDGVALSPWRAAQRLSLARSAPVAAVAPDPSLLGEGAFLASLEEAVR